MTNAKSSHEVLLSFLVITTHTSLLMNQNESCYELLLLYVR